MSGITSSLITKYTESNREITNIQKKDITIKLIIPISPSMYHLPKQTLPYLQLHTVEWNGIHL